MAKLVEKTYGDALLELSVESGNMDELFEEAKAVKEILEVNSELVQLLNHPKVGKEEKIKVLEEVFKGKITDDMLGFILLVVRKDRQKELIKVLGYFIDQVKEYKKIGVATVTTAVELDEKQKESIAKKLIDTTSYNSFEIEYSIDKSLIGGMIIRVGDKVIDSTIKSKIENMSRDLYKIRLEM